MKQGKRGRIALVIIAAGILLAYDGFAQTAPQENTGANANIVRWAKGAYEYRTISDRRYRGREEWNLFAYKDGTRTISMWTDLFALNSQTTSVFHIGSDGRPLDAYISLQRPTGFGGAAFFIVRQGGLSWTSTGPNGPVAGSLDINGNFSISTGPLASDGWHGWYYDYAKGGEQPSQYVSISAAPGQPIAARMIDTKRTFLGEETLSLPAGTFKAKHFKTGQADTWLGTEDGVVLKQVSATSDREYVLIEYKTGPSPLGTLKP